MVVHDESARAAKIEKRDVVSPDAPRRRERARVGSDAYGVHPAGRENTARPANVRAVRLRRTARALQSGRKPLVKKVILF